LRKLALPLGSLTPANASTWTILSSSVQVKTLTIASSERSPKPVTLPSFTPDASTRV
jgi:hypothetical protein